MKKRKLNLGLNKSTIVKLQNNQMLGIQAGAATRTWDNTCLDRSEYPACAYTGNYYTSPCDVHTW